MRIHFDGKEEFRFVEPIVQSFSMVQVHPVLIDYQFAWESIFLASACTEPQEVLNRLAEEVTSVLDGWHDAARYLTHTDVLGLLRGGYGLLLEAPIPVSNRICDVLTAARLQFTRLPRGGPRWPREALLLDKSFVVARSFRIEQLER